MPDTLAHLQALGIMGDIVKHAKPIHRRRVRVAGMTYVDHVSPIGNQQEGIWIREHDLWTILYDDCDELTVLQYGRKKIDQHDDGVHVRLYKQKSEEE
jgi:2-polyprenyl-6-methoxyphenol hydroxylase-like FAD-dependent oxidoreductase